MPLILVLHDRSWVTLNLPQLLGNASLVRRISGGVKRRKRSCRPPRGAKCYIQGRRDRRRIGVESRRPRESAASLGTWAARTPTGTGD